jgi:HEAT repeat protein
MLEGDVEGLVAVLRDESRSGPERRYAAAALGNLHARQAVAPLVSVMDDTEVCDTVIQSLVAIGDPIAAAPLAELFASTDDRWFRNTAKRALHLLYEKDPRGVRQVLEDYEQSQKEGSRPKHRGR